MSDISCIVYCHITKVILVASVNGNRQEKKKRDQQTNKKKRFHSEFFFLFNLHVFTFEKKIKQLMYQTMKEIKMHLSEIRYEILSSDFIFDDFCFEDTRCTKIRKNEDMMNKTHGSICQSKLHKHTHTHTYLYTCILQEIIDFV